MNKKKFFAMLSALIIISNLFTSCAQKYETYTLDYPEYLTIEYLRENYVDADPYLMFLSSAENSFATDSNPNKFSYYGSKNISYDHFVWKVGTYASLGATKNAIVMRHKDYDVEPLKDYTVSDAYIIYYKYGHIEDEKKYDGYDRGQELYEHYNVLGQYYFKKTRKIDVNHEKLITHIRTALENNDFFDSLESEVSPMLVSKVKLQICFEEYDELIWLGRLYMAEDQDSVSYYVACNVWHDEYEYYKYEKIKLPDEISSQIHEVLPEKVKKEMEEEANLLKQLNNIKGESG